MTNKKKFTWIIFMASILLAGIFLLNMNFISAEASFCCEKTKVANDGSGGAWCQNSIEENCDTEFRKVPTSCEATSYCKLGTCVNSQEGTCTENTPESVCSDNGGLWKAEEKDEIPQCQLGCCLIGEQAAFVTQTRCKKLSSVYGLETNYRTDIRNEVDCIASATSDVKGACVFDKEFERTCEFLSKRACSNMEVSSSEESNVEFYEGFLCSDETLGTNCGPSKKTTCIEGRDEVYFLDTCGNLANIYDSSKVTDLNYWSKVSGPTCGSGSNADSPNCGDCDYFRGSTCKTYKRSEDNVKPNYGDNICRDLGCEYEGVSYQHGETWCADSSGIDQSLPGSRSFRLVCYNGDVNIEPCADFRQESCIQSEVNGFKTAACRVNMWQDCYSQGNKKDCENPDKRDCEWLPERSVCPEGESCTWKGRAWGDIVKCVPANSPGFNFWETETEAQSVCAQASKQCIIKTEKDIFGKKKVVGGQECVNKDSWKSEMNDLCTSLGDCGTGLNYIGKKGY